MLPGMEVSHDTFLWPDKSWGPWLVTFETAPIEGRQQLIGLQIRSYASDFEGEYKRQFPSEKYGNLEAAKVLTSTQLRKLALGRLLDELFSDGSLMVEVLEGTTAEGGELATEAARHLEAVREATTSRWRRRASIRSASASGSIRARRWQARSGRRSGRNTP